MTDQNTVEATETTAAAAAAPKAEGRAIFGNLADITSRNARSGKPYVTGRLVATRTDGTVAFEHNITAFGTKAIAALKDLGNGARVSLYGAFEQVERNGGKFTEEVFQVWKATSMARKADDAAADAEVPAEANAEVPF